LCQFSYLLYTFDKMYKPAVIHIVNGDRQKCGTSKTAKVMNDDIRPT